jgi:hypothetical protein
MEQSGSWSTRGARLEVAAAAAAAPRVASKMAILAIVVV